jgi:hypothetical protein
MILMNVFVCNQYDRTYDSLDVGLFDDCIVSQSIQLDVQVKQFSGI